MILSSQSNLEYKYSVKQLSKSYFFLIKYDLDESIYEDRDLPSTDSLEAWSKIGKEDADRKIDLYIAFGKDSEYYGTVGEAWVGGACTPYDMTSMNEWRRTPVETAMASKFFE